MSGNSSSKIIHYIHTQHGTHFVLYNESSHSFSIANIIATLDMHVAIFSGPIVVIDVSDVLMHVHAHLLYYANIEL